MNPSISSARDRLQSRVLLGVTLPVLAVLALQYFAYAGLHRRGLSLLGISLTFAAVVRLLRAATSAAAATGGLLCFLIALGTIRFDRSVFLSGLLPLAALFLLTLLATRAGRAPREADSRELAEIRHGRGTAQVIANLGVAAFVAGLRANVPSLLFTAPILVLAALAEATADTVSSELGRRFGGTPILLTTLRPVPAGTDGGISPLGTAAGLLAAALVILTGAFALALTPTQSLIALLAAAAGLFFDSFLGATLERRALLNNDLVNFLSTLFAAAVAWFFIVHR